MKNKFLLAGLVALSSVSVYAQDDVYPAKNEKKHYFITGATIHVGNGTVINNGSIEVVDGKIAKIGENLPMPSGATTIDAKGKQIYPGLILPVTDLGLKEIGGSATRGTNDFRELGDYNPNIRSIVAYNADSKIINTLKSNGILLAGVAPEGGTIMGSSTLVQLDAWKWEDAAYKMDDAMHMRLPSLLNRRGGGRRGGGFPGGPNGGAAGGVQADPLKQSLDKIEELKTFLREARAYNLEATHKEHNLKYAALKGIFDKSQKVFMHADETRQMLVAIEMAKEFNLDLVIVGGSESWQIADILKQNNVSVILNEQHALPSTEDDDIDQPFKTPAMLQKAGVVFALNDENEETRYRNLPFNAGTAVAYGLGKEEAIQAMTLNAAKIMGVSDKTGSLEVGKDANLIITEGDLLDMKTSVIERAFIRGRDVDLNNKQKQLNERYELKYDLKKAPKPF
ncbi:MAG: amidohydrolase family protein [Chitinophagaceae bacterium]